MSQYGCVVYIVGGVPGPMDRLVYFSSSSFFQGIAAGSQSSL